MTQYTPNYVAAKEQELAEQYPNYHRHQDVGMVLLFCFLIATFFALRLWDRLKPQQ